MAADSEDLLPDYLSPMDRHFRKLRTGLHPTVDWGENLSSIKWGRDRDDVYVGKDDGSHLVHLLDGDTACPVCGERGTIELKRGWTFVRGAEDGDFSAGEKPEAGGGRLGKKLEERGYRTIVCRARSADGDWRRFYVGLAHPKAVEDYEEYRETVKQRSGVRGRSGTLRSTSRSGLWEPARALDGKYDHGDILAAIFDLLGAETYDAMDLHGRTNITKAQLAALLDRLHALEFQERRDYDAEDWYVHREFGVGHGRVQWHVPEWVDAETLEWGSGLEELFE